MNNSARHSIMSDAERVKGLLDGSMDPIELEGDSELYSLAERIYGREALDEMGVSAPERSPEVDPAIHSNEGDLDVELPDVPEDQGDSDESARGSSGHRIMLIAGLVGLVMVSVNVAVGLGQYLALCEDELESPPVTFTTSSTLQNSEGVDKLHITWTASNLNTSVNYSIHWSISPDGSAALVDSGWHNWSASSAMAHSDHFTVMTPPWCYISILYSEGIEISQSNACIDDSSTSSVLADITTVPKLCEDNTRLLWNKAAEYQSIDSWSPAGTGGLLDGALLMLFGMITLRTVFKKK